MLIIVSGGPEGPGSAAVCQQPGSAKPVSTFAGTTAFRGAPGERGRIELSARPGLGVERVA